MSVRLPPPPSLRGAEVTRISRSSDDVVLGMDNTNDNNNSHQEDDSAPAPAPPPRPSYQPRANPRPLSVYGTTTASSPALLEPLPSASSPSSAFPPQPNRPAPSPRPSSSRPLSVYGVPKQVPVRSLPPPPTRTVPPPLVTQDDGSNSSSSSDRTDNHTASSASALPPISTPPPSVASLPIEEVPRGDRDSSFAFDRGPAMPSFSTTVLPPQDSTHAAAEMNQVREFANRSQIMIDLLSSPQRTAQEEQLVNEQRHFLWGNYAVICHRLNLGSAEMNKEVDAALCKFHRAESLWHARIPSFQLNAKFFEKPNARSAMFTFVFVAQSREAALRFTATEMQVVEPRDSCQILLARHAFSDIRTVVMLLSEFVIIWNSTTARSDHVPYAYSVAPSKSEAHFTKIPVYIAERAPHVIFAGWMRASKLGRCFARLLPEGLLLFYTNDTVEQTQVLGRLAVYSIMSIISKAITGRALLTSPFPYPLKIVLSNGTKIRLSTAAAAEQISWFELLKRKASRVPPLPASHPLPMDTAIHIYQPPRPVASSSPPPRDQPAWSSPPERAVSPPRVKETLAQRVVRALSPTRARPEVMSDDAASSLRGFVTKGQHRIGDGIRVVNDRLQVLDGLTVVVDVEARTVALKPQSRALEIYYSDRQLTFVPAALSDINVVVQLVNAAAKFTPPAAPLPPSAIKQPPPASSSPSPFPPISSAALVPSSSSAAAASPPPPVARPKARSQSPSLARPRAPQVNAVPQAVVATTPPPPSSSSDNLIVELARVLMSHLERFRSLYDSAAQDPSRPALRKLLGELETIDFRLAKETGDLEKGLRYLLTSFQSETLTTIISDIGKNSNETLVVLRSLLTCLAAAILVDLKRSTPLRILREDLLECLQALTAKLPAADASKPVAVVQSPSSPSPAVEAATTEEETKAKKLKKKKKHKKKKNKEGLVDDSSSASNKTKLVAAVSKPAIVLHDFAAQESVQVSVVRGERVIFIAARDEWAWVEKENKSAGYIPGYFLDSWELLNGKSFP